MFTPEINIFLYNGKKYFYEICFNKNDLKYWLAFFADYKGFETKEKAFEYLQKEGENLILEYLSYFPNYDGDGKGFLPYDDEDRESMYIEFK